MLSYNISMSGNSSSYFPNCLLGQIETRRRESPLSPSVACRNVALSERCWRWAHPASWFMLTTHFTPNWYFRPILPWHTRSVSRKSHPPLRNSCCRSSSSRSIMTGWERFLVFLGLPVAKDFFRVSSLYISYPISSTPPSETQSAVTLARDATVL